MVLSKGDSRSRPIRSSARKIKPTKAEPMGVKMPRFATNPNGERDSRPPRQFSGSSRTVREEAYF